ncbi:MAG: hypothetical protein D6814_11125 [Calditrichaeota bacterium]|nr:MAG: hypothetical protein D6814_11125 [Calditrichota bacterium]
MGKEKRVVDGKQQFTAEVFPAEINEIKSRRQKVLGQVHEKLDKATSPNTNLGLVGLAFSGGGIRSATFNLGVSQAMVKYGVFKYVDYLSTVSGGGFIGSCLSSVLNTPYTGPDFKNFPFHHEPGVEEPLAFRYLRNNSNYLAPGGMLDKLRIPALLIRGILINLLVFLPYIVLAVWITNLFYGNVFRQLAAGQVTMQWSQLIFLTPYAMLAFVLWVALFLLGQRLFRKKLLANYRYRNAYELSFAVGLLIILLAIAVDLVPSAFFAYIQEIHIENKSFWSLLSAAAGLVPYLFADKAAKNLSKWYGKFSLYLLGLLGPAIFLILYVEMANYMILSASPHATQINMGIYLATALLFLYVRWAMDVNATSVHSFYRDRLSKAFLFFVNQAGDQIIPNDAQSLTSLSGPNTRAPYHLLNVTLNLQGSDDPNLRGRDADFFIFSKHFSGGFRTGFCPTPDLEKVDPHLNLATAMAISGAAVAPNSGSTTIKPLVFILTLLNLRLGYWVPNPMVMAKSKKLFLKRVKTEYLLKELFSRVNEDSWFVNVTDGGHLENLGIYELLRRRCRLIIASDAEADVNLEFGGLSKLIRYARIDLAIEIDINLDEIRKGKNGLSQQHWTVGKIDYGHGQTGYLIYMKSSLTGNEEEYVKAYKARNPDFPHESTADQFFDEAQFEVYRALGYHIAKDVFKQKEVGEILRRFIEENERIDLVEALDVGRQNKPSPGFKAQVG